jgi:hypothetical protein
MKKPLLTTLIVCCSFFILCSQTLPETGISGVYEVMVGADPSQKNYMIKYFGEFGFMVKDSANYSAAQAKEMYGVESKLQSFRLQNGAIDSHGLLRILVWDKPTGDGLGYVQPETIGQRMAVMKTNEIIRLVDIYKAERANGEK